MKSLPYFKTVVTRLVIEVADALKRQTQLTASIATKIATGDSFSSGDVVIESSHTFNPKNCIILSSFEPFSVEITVGQSSVTLQSQGLFVHHGSADSITVSVQKITRIKYVVS